MAKRAGLDSSRGILARADLATLIALLRDRGYLPVGPQVRNGAVEFAPLASDADLPIGWRCVQAPGSYRLEQTGDQRVFGVINTAGGAKGWLNPAQRRLWTSERSGASLVVKPDEEPPPKLALIGLRACDLAAISIQDQVMTRRKFVDQHYAATRAGALLVAVNCGSATSVCFCSSMEAGPEVRAGFDLCLTELLDSGGHRFFVQAATPTGAEILESLTLTEPSAADMGARDAEIERAKTAITKSLDTADLKDTIYRNVESPHWKSVASQCLACGSCTMVCPTCFCSTVEDRTEMSLRRAERWRKWDSCFEREFSYVHGGALRQSVASRYRQWLTHKLASWTDQFGTLGCVGCGRCIAWCPVGIDLTEQVRLIRSGEPAGKALR